MNYKQLYDDHSPSPRFRTTDDLLDELLDNREPMERDDEMISHYDRANRPEPE